MRARTWILAIAAAVIAAAAFLAWRLKEHPGRHMRLEITHVSLRSTAPGIDPKAADAVALSYGTIAPAVREIVVSIEAKAACGDGDRLERGDVILRLDRTILHPRSAPGAPDRLTKAVAKYGFTFSADTTVFRGLDRTSLAMLELPVRSGCGDYAYAIELRPRR